MARKQTNTADYFPHRVNHGKTVFKLEAKYGNDGYAFLFKLFEMLGASENHYLDISDPGDWDFFVVKMRMEDERCRSILNDLIAWNKIDKELFDTKKIIWYDKFLQGLSTLYHNRRREMPAKPDFYGRNDSQIGVPTGESTQSKVEERIEEKSKVKNLSPVSVEPEGSKEGGIVKDSKYQRFLNLFNHTCNREFRTMNEKAQRQLDKLLKKDFTKKDFIKAISNGYEIAKSWSKPELFTPEYITREHEFEKYLYMDHSSKNNESKGVAPAGFNIKKMLEEQQNKVYR